MPAKTPAATRAYDLVKLRILHGVYADTTLLSEGDVATELGLSRTPVREAFLRLEVEGFLKLYPKRGALVVPIPPEGIREVYEARELIESHSARHICAQDQDFRGQVCGELEELIGAQLACLRDGDLQEYTRLDAAFHQVIMDHGGNSVLAAVGQSLREKQQRCTSTAIGRNLDTAYHFVEGHRRIVLTLRAGDTAAYAREIHQHLADSQAQLSAQR
ncbi:GntR family transcriptional regulator [Corynebacterium lizhenjunii]|uniref:GntR family transcriptional regulator n=1 Tax=Corynebacterium lizhenjunii TaxID=2709394 RepID=A0A7T0KDH6_9CORY|nr:GntR family transcriptional regulator [Corynebacterium lizhenjunii]QPK78494.1 GntR family transcriptional regulator [Corynebacterium lizhenjunii]